MEQYIDEFDIELVNQSLTFDTTDMHVQGTCDLFTTKPIGIDRKLYKRLDRRYSTSRHETSSSEDEGSKQQGRALGRSNSDSKVVPRSEEKSLSKRKSVEELKQKTPGDNLTAEEQSKVAADGAADDGQSQYISPEFMQLKKRSYSYSYPYKRSQLAKYLLNSNVSSKHGRERRGMGILGAGSASNAASLAKPRSKSFHYSMTGHSGEALDLLRSNRDTETLDYYSPFGPLSQQSSRRLFAYLIAILNLTYPDHDFSLVQPTNFSLLTSPEVLVKRVNSLLISLGKSKRLDWIWQTIDTHMDITQCTCFQYEPEQSFLGDLPGTLWCNMYFMYNKKRKRVAFLCFRATTLQGAKTGSSASLSAEERRDGHAGTASAEEEYDLRDEARFSRDANSPIYEDVFDEEEEDADDGDGHGTGSAEPKSQSEEAVYEKSKSKGGLDGTEEEDNDDRAADSESDYAMDEDELANENQDDEDDYGNTAEVATDSMDID